MGCTTVLLYCLWQRYRRSPRLVGRLRVLRAPADYAGSSVIDLSGLGRRSARIGGERAEIDLPPRGSPWARLIASADGCGVDLSANKGRTVRVNSYDVSGPHLLSDGDTVTADDVTLRYERLDFGG